MKHVFAALLLLAAPAFALTPQEEYQKNIADENMGYAQVPHAMLKIQDSAYIGEGQSATVWGRAGAPASYHWEPGAGGTLTASIHGGKLNLTMNGKPALGDVTKGIPLDSDIDVVGQPTQVGANVMGWRLFLYNQRSPIAKAFKGVSYYPFNPAFRVSATFTPDLKLPPRVFRTSRGTAKQFYHAGEAHFKLMGKDVTLPFYTGDRAQVADMSAFYTDKLTGKGAYGAGRYVDVAGFGKFPPAQIVIDFNQAYNPNCARSAHFTCPVAVDDIPVAMTVGERDPHYHGP